MVKTDFTEQTQQKLLALLQNLENDHAAISVSAARNVQDGAAVYQQLVDAVQHCLQNLHAKPEASTT